MVGSLHDIIDKKMLIIIHLIKINYNHLHLPQM
jgi:hypothetical protein